MPASRQRRIGKPLRGKRRKVDPQLESGGNCSREEHPSRRRFESGAALPSPRGSRESSPRLRGAELGVFTEIPTTIEFYQGSPFETEKLEATRRQIEQSIQRCAIAKGRRQRIEGSIWNRLWITYFDDEPQRGFNSALGSNAVACDHNWSTPELEE